MQSSTATPSRLDKDVEQLPLARCAILHLLPGAAIFTFYAVFAPIIIKLGLPPDFALLLGFVFVGIPLELGYLVYQGKSLNRTISLRGIILFRKPMPIWQYFVFSLLIVALAFGVLYLTSPITARLQLLLVYLVYWKRNIYIAIIAHCGLNTIGAALSLTAYYGTGRG